MRVLLLLCIASITTTLHAKSKVQRLSMKMMALATFARRFQRAHHPFFLTSILKSLNCQQAQSSHASFSHPTHSFSRAFHQTHFLLSRTFPVNPHSDTSQASHNYNLYDAINFNQHINEAHKQNQSDVRKLSELLKNVDSFPSEEEAMTLLEESGIKPNKSLVYSAIWDFREEWKLSFLVFKWGEKWGCNCDENWNLIIWVLGSHKKFNTAWYLIHDLHRSSLDTRQPMLIMIDRYAAANDPGKAIEAFQKMERFSMAPDLKAFYTLLIALCKNGNIEEAEEFMLLNKKLFPLEAEGFNIILNGWCNISLDVYEAKRVWREMSKCCILPNEASYTQMISCFSKVENLFDSLRLYDEMKRRGWVPGLEVYNSLIYVLTHENCLNEALKIVDKIKELGIQPNSATYNSMICPLCEAAKPEEAKTILATMIGDNVSPTIETYHALLEGASLEGTLEVLNHMRKAGLGPTKATFLSILGKFFKTKQPENALKIWVEMKEYEVLPDSTHYTVLIEGLVRCGVLSKAREFYAEMISNGIRDDPKLKKLIKVSGQNGNHQREGQGQVRSVRHTKKPRQAGHGKCRATKHSRTKTNGAT